MWITNKEGQALTGLSSSAFAHYFEFCLSPTRGSGSGTPKLYNKNMVIKQIKSWESIKRSYTPIKVDGLPPYWYINRQGEVMSCTPTHGIIPVRCNPSCNQYGYEVIYPRYVDGKIRALLVSRAVALTFIPNPNNLPVVNHIDGNKRNNHVENLEWCTAYDNALHAQSHSLLATGLQKKNTQPVAVYLGSELIDVQPSLKDTSIKYEIDLTTLHHHIRGLIKRPLKKPYNQFTYKMISRGEYYELSKSLSQ